MDMITVFYVVFIAAAAVALLYILAIMPRLGHKKESREFARVYYAHRGLHDNRSEAPENSMPAFKKAVKGGYGIEMDVQLTKDGVPVVFHDFTLERACGKKGKVCEFTYEELQAFELFQSREKIPRLQDVLSLVDGRVPLIIEYKIEWLDFSVCPIADKLLSEYQGSYCIESFNPIALFWYRRYRNQVVRGQLSDGFLKSGEFKGTLYFILQNLLLNWASKPDFIAYNHKYANNPSRKLCHGLFRHPAAAWTIRSQKELEAAKDKFDLFIFDSFIPRKV